MEHEIGNFYLVIKVCQLRHSTLTAREVVGTCSAKASHYKTQFGTWWNKTKKKKKPKGWRLFAFTKSDFKQLKNILMWLEVTVISDVHQLVKHTHHFFLSLSFFFFFLRSWWCSSGEREPLQRQKNKRTVFNPVVLCQAWNDKAKTDSFFLTSPSSSSSCSLCSDFDYVHGCGGVCCGNDETLTKLSASHAWQTKKKNLFFILTLFMSIIGTNTWNP